MTKKASPATLQDRLEEATPTAIRFKDGDVFAGIFDCDDPECGGRGAV